MHPAELTPASINRSLVNCRAEGAPMPVFGKTLFETVLDGLDQPEEEDVAEAGFPVRGFNGGFVGQDWSGRVDAGSDPSLLFDGFPPDPVVQEPDIPDWIDRLSDAEIAEDLSLGNAKGESEIRERRRLFALENHPDRVSADYREQATRRMMIANQLIDKALAKTR
jgi:hypothetical protein